MSRRLLLFVLLGAALCACGGDGDSPATSGPIDVSGDPVRLGSAELTAEFARNPYRLRVLSHGAVLAEERASAPFYERGGDRHQLVRVVAARAVDGGVDLEVETSEGSTAQVSARLRSERTLRITVAPPNAAVVTALGDSFASPPDERIYGLTERLRDSPPLAPPQLEIPREDIMPVEVGSLDRRGEIVEMLIRPTFGLYTPFFHSSRGYGLYVEGTAIGAFDLAHTDAEAIAFRFEAGRSDASHELVFDIFAGPEHAQILDEYTAVTGRPLVPPDWAFLNWRWRDALDPGPTATLDGNQINAMVAEDVQMFETLGIPPGVYHFDRPTLSGQYGFARFVWDENRVPNAEAMLASLRSRGYHLTAWSSTWVCGSEEGDNGYEAQRLGFLAPGPGGTPNCADLGGRSFILDVTNPEARAWFGDRVRTFVERYDLDGVKLDRGEEHIPTEVSDVWFDGRNGREVRNDYPNLQARLHREALDAAHPGGEFVLISRAGYAGAQQDTIIWGGDIGGSEGFGRGPGTDLGLRSAIISQLRAAFMGFPIWGSDTGGYYEFKDREVFARWIEFSAFSGIMEIGGTGNHAPWNMPTEPKYDAELIDIYRRYARLRETLLPYISSAAAEAARSGLPLVRPLVFAFRDDPAVADLWDEYLFGPDLLVAPIWHIGQRSREVYFPRGEWRSYWNEEERVDGPATITVDVPLDSIPVYVRGSAEVPR